jgi:hypothetical protein
MSNPPPDIDAPEPVLLIIADISGYTRYMTANAKTLSHSQTIITELITAIIKQVELPLEVAKLEGDAIFLYCRKQQTSQRWSETKRIIGDKLVTFFRMFGEKVSELSQSTTCTCNACTHIEKLQLKVVVHSGEVLFHRVLNFLELAGVDVIIVHRLLKNSVRADQYLLLTEPASHELEFSKEIQLSQSTETHDDIGRIKTLIYLPDGERKSEPATPPFKRRFAQSFKVFCKLWFAPFASHSNSFRHVTSSTSGAARTAFAVLTALLTPIFLPVGTVTVLFRTLGSSAKSQHADNCHEHKSDGSCCHKH